MKILQTVILLFFMSVNPSVIPGQTRSRSPAPHASSFEDARSFAASQEKANRAPGKVKPLRPRYEELGRSVRGRAIEAIIYGTGKKRVVVVGGIHGNEENTTVIARSLAVTLGRDSVPDGLTVIVVPDANPDGLLSHTRVNDRGVDINRNFPSKSWRIDYPDAQHFPGKEPASEPETRALINLLERYPPDLLITLHAALGCMNWDGPGSEIASLMARVNKYPLCEYLGYETPGSLGTYAGIDRKIPTVTIELRAVNAVQLVQENLPALLAALKNFDAGDLEKTKPVAAPVRKVVNAPKNKPPSLRAISVGLSLLM